MHRTLFAIAAGLALTAACQRPRDTSFLAADAHAASLATAPAASTDRTVGSMPSLSPLVKQLRPVVVNISTTTKAKAMSSRRRFHSRGAPRQFGPGGPGDDQGQGGDDQGQGQGGDDMERFFRFFAPGGPGGGGQGGQGMRSPERHGLGSGFSIGNGLVLTNNHVVEGADEIKVTTDPSAPGGTREFTGKVIGRDAATDIALVQLEGDKAKDLPAAQLGSSDATEVGDYVIAIGEPFGFTATVTSGIVSAKERSLRSSNFDDFIQTDASINPGNSGGPLFNLKGEVVGVNTAIISGANSIGFAIPIDLVKQELPQLKEKGKVVRGFLGVTVQPVTQDIASGFGRSTTDGALVTDAIKDSPAAKAGLKAGDIITQVNGKPIRDERHLTRTIAQFAPGTDVHLGVFRDKKERDLDLRVGTRPSDDGADEDARPGDQGEQGGSDVLGVQVEDITPELAQRARLQPGTKGAIVTDVAPDSPASQSLEPGDVIVELNRRPIESAQDYKRSIKDLKKGDTALLRVQTRGGARYQTVHIK